MHAHDEWVQQIEAEIEGELTLAQRAALARHLVACQHCAGARASHLELRASLAAAAGDTHARALPPNAITRRALVAAIALALAAGAALGWLGQERLNGPGARAGTLEESRATIVAP
jgi:hypothetical protein